MRSRTIVTAIATIASLASLTPVRADECIVVGSPTTFGADMNGTFEVDAGESCHYAFRLRGAVESSRILTPAKNGTVRMLNLTSFEYRPHPGYRGTDSFAIEASGESQTGKGASVLNMTVRVK
jgi:hypothetical protein